MFVRFVTDPPQVCLIWKVTQHVITAGGWGKISLQSEQLPGGRGRGRGVHCSGTTPCNHTTSPPHHTTPPLQPQKLFTQDHVEGWQEKITLHLPVFVFVFFIYCVEWNVPLGFFSGRTCEELFSEICMYANHEWPKHDFFRNHQVRNHSPGMWE